MQALRTAAYRIMSSGMEVLHCMTRRFCHLLQEPSITESRILTEASVLISSRISSTFRLSEWKWQVHEPQQSRQLTFSQTEVLGAAGAVAGLLEVAFGLIMRIRKAYERQQNLIEVLDKHALAVQNVKEVVQAVADEDALQTATVASELAKLEVIGKKLMRCLREQYPTDQRKVRQFTHQLVKGTKDEDRLADIMTDLDRAQAALSLRVQLANVGLTRMVHNTILANAEAINRIDQRLNEIFGDGRGLKLASLLKDASPEGSCSIILSIIGIGGS
jgi:hypothetical protein